MSVYPNSAKHIWTKIECECEHQISKYGVMSWCKPGNFISLLYCPAVILLHHDYFDKELKQLVQNIILKYPLEKNHIAWLSCHLHHILFYFL